MNTISQRMLRLPEVRDITGVSRSSIYKWMDEGKFPPSRQLSERAIAWDSREIAKWVDSRPVHEEY
jgi:prophage regulatory protein